MKCLWKKKVQDAKSQCTDPFSVKRPVFTFSVLFSLILHFNIKCIMDVGMIYDSQRREAVPAPLWREGSFSVSILTSTQFPSTSWKRTQKGSDLEATSRSSRLFAVTDSSTRVTQC